MGTKLLDETRIRGLHQAALNAGLAASRADLLRGLEASFVASLPVSSSLSAQLLTDLHELSVALRDGSVPVVVWLKNAVSLAGGLGLTRFEPGELEEFLPEGQKLRLPDDYLFLPLPPPPARPARSDKSRRRLSVEPPSPATITIAARISISKRWNRRLRPPETLANVPRLTDARTAAITRRDALAQAWETAFAGLKRAARSAEDDGAKGLHGVLFERAKAAPKRKKEPRAPTPK